MRIYGTNAASLSAKPAAARRTGAGGGFSLSETAAPSNTAAATSLRSVGGLDSLLALQGVDDVMERRKRGVARGRNALDVLDELKMGVLGGDLSPSTMTRLKVAAEGLTEETGDSGLDGVLAEIDLRVAVEIAKAARR